MMRHTAMFLGHSRANLAAFEPTWEQQPGKFRHVPNGTTFPATELDRQECRRRLGLKGDDIAVLHVATLRIEKNHQELIAIFSAFHRRNPKAVLLVVGMGPREPELRAMAAASGCGDRIRFEGSQIDVWPYYYASNIFLFTSTHEGFANVLIEAQGAGLPVVASDIPPHRESVAPPQQRFLYLCGRIDDAVRRMDEQLAAAAAGANPWVAQSRAFVRSMFTAERMADALADLYQEVAGTANIEDH